MHSSPKVDFLNGSALSLFIMAGIMRRTSVIQQKEFRPFSSQSLTVGLIYVHQRCRLTFLCCIFRAIVFICWTQKETFVLGLSGIHLLSNDEGVLAENLKIDATGSETRLRSFYYDVRRGNW